MWIIFLVVIIIILLLRYSWKGGFDSQKKLELYIREPWFSEIVAGRKNIEGRAGHESKFKSWIDMKVIFKNPKNHEFITVKITKVNHYKDLYEYLDNEDNKIVAPHLKLRKDIINAYHEFYSDLSIKEKGGMNALYFIIL